MSFPKASDTELFQGDLRRHMLPMNDVLHFPTHLYNKFHDGYRLNCD